MNFADRNGRKNCWNEPYWMGRKCGPLGCWISRDVWRRLPQNGWISITSGYINLTCKSLTFACDLILNSWDIAFLWIFLTDWFDWFIHQGTAIRDRIQERLKTQQLKSLLYDEWDDDDDVYDDESVEYYSD